MWSLAIAGVQGTGACSRLIRTAGVVLGATEVTVRAVLDVLVHWGAAVQRRPRDYSAATGPRRWVRSRKSGGTVPDATGITPSGVHNEGRQVAGGRSPRKEETSISHLVQNPTPSHTQKLSPPGISSLVLHCVTGKIHHSVADQSCAYQCLLHSGRDTGDTHMTDHAMTMVTRSVTSTRKALRARVQGAWPVLVG